jgi:hypothetical protein
MKQVEAQRKIITLWCKRNVARRTELDVLAFYNEIKHNHPELLNFIYKRPDKYHRVKEWILPYVT